MVKSKAGHVQTVAYSESSSQKRSQFPYSFNRVITRITQDMRREKERYLMCPARTCTQTYTLYGMIDFFLLKYELYVSRIQKNKIGMA